MKRFKDCSLQCLPNQTAHNLLNVVRLVCDENGLGTQMYEGEYSYIIVKLIDSRNLVSNLVVCPNEAAKSVSIINIFPDHESSQKQLSVDEYNDILEKFKDVVFLTIQRRDGNDIMESDSEYTMANALPKSYKKLQKWLNNYPLSGHSFDLNRWYDFIISLFQNKEYVDPFAFREYLVKEYSWAENDAERYVSKCEEQLGLLKYYVETTR